MAKRKSKESNPVSAAPSSGGNRMHLGIDSAENGLVVHIDGQRDGKYFEKKFVATSPRQAFRIAAEHIPSIGKKSGSKKKGGKKRVSFKKV